VAASLRLEEKRILTWVREKLLLSREYVDDMDYVEAHPEATREKSFDATKRKEL